MKHLFHVIFFSGVLACTSASSVQLPISLSETVSPSAIHDIRSGPVQIAGHLGNTSGVVVLVRVTTSLGETAHAKILSKDGRFECLYPADFPGARALKPGMLFVDATTNRVFGANTAGDLQAEAALVLHAGPKGLPELPSAFTSDLLDRVGRKDEKSSEWAVVRQLANLYMRSRAARLVGVGRDDFELANPADLAWFKNNLTLYEFDHRDKDWRTPLGHRVERTFWQSVWNNWFNAGNSHPLDGNPANRASTNYLPYGFANDFADVLIMTIMRKQAGRSVDDNLTTVCREASQNLIAMQHRESNNFALSVDGKRETYTAGAFRYGMFENGEFMTEGKGWFYNPAHRDYAEGGVLNGRALWGLGESLRSEPNGPLADDLQAAIALTLKFCLHDGTNGGYVKTTSSGNRYWKDAGEHAYLLLGMLAACEVAPNMPVRLAEDAAPSNLKALCVESLNALVELETPALQWSPYPNVDSMVIAALAQGAKLLHSEPGAARWRESAVRVADAWLAARVDTREWPGAPIHFGFRGQPDRMTYIWMNPTRPQIFYYQTGHWIHALADVFALTGEPRFRDRAEALISYLCGNNPWQLRLFNELGAVYNWSDDTNGDGVQDLLKQDMYPESTAFCQIGIMRLLGASAGK